MLHFFSSLMTVFNSLGGLYIFIDILSPRIVGNAEMLAINEAHKKLNSKILLQIHDELLIEAPEEEAEIQLEIDLIEATIAARKRCNITQRELSERTGIKQPAIARIESRARSPQASTLIRLLYPMGYTLRVVPISDNREELLQE